MICTAADFWNADESSELFVDRSVSGIYAIRNTVNQKLYVGSALSIYDRLYNHIWHLEKSGKHRNIKLLNAWRKYKLTAFSLEILEIVESPNCLIEREQFWIDELDAVASGYNLSPKAGSNLGRIWSPAMRQAVADGVRRAMADPIVRERVKQSTRSAMNRPDVKRKCSDHLKKRWKDPTARLVLMAALNASEKRKQHVLNLQEHRRQVPLETRRAWGIKGSPGKRYRVIHPNGLITSIVNLKKFCQEHSIFYSAAIGVLSGRNRQTKGYRFEKADAPHLPIRPDKRKTQPNRKGKRKEQKTMGILVIGSVKGGVGKTTLAVNFAVALAQCGQDVLLIDGDDQGHAQAFTELRAAQRPDQGPGYTAVALIGQQIRTQVRQLRDRYDHIVIDVGGRDTSSLRNALMVSDLILVPCQPRSFDLWGAESTGELVSQARDINEHLKALVVINMADATGNDNNIARSSLEDLEGLEVAETRIGRRKALPNAIAEGLGILEYQGDSAAKAQAEFSELFTSIYPNLKLERKIA